jgi:hypothetical protein
MTNKNASVDMEKFMHILASYMDYEALDALVYIGAIGEDEKAECIAYYETDSDEEYDDSDAE